MMHSESQEVLDVYKAQAKQIIKKLNSRSVSRDGGVWMEVSGCV